MSLECNHSCDCTDCQWRCAKCYGEIIKNRNKATEYRESEDKKPIDVIDELIWQYSATEQKLLILKNLITSRLSCEDKN